MLYICVHPLYTNFAIIRRANVQHIFGWSHDQEGMTIILTKFISDLHRRFPNFEQPTNSDLWYSHHTTKLWSVTTKFFLKASTTHSEKIDKINQHLDPRQYRFIPISWQWITSKCTYMNKKFLYLCWIWKTS